FSLPASSWPSPAHSLIWQSSVAPALVRNGFRLLGNRLVVPRDGLYFVYAAAAFQGRRCPRPLRLAVSRFSPEYPRDVPLLRAARSVCRAGAGTGTGTGPWAESLYQGAVFQLRRGDRLAATASAGRFLDLHAAGQAYFGVLGVDLRRGDRLAATASAGRFLDLHAAGQAYFGGGFQGAPRILGVPRGFLGGCPGGPWAESLYQGAVFQLRRGDRLAATASAGRFLDLHAAGQAYFGVLGVD
ncbi:tumor necrosis factor-like, partial [Taeniopygia guttata]|uniref:tumor necrosis factor-like n=1 Tax=Taeniopygia guttata TaxID=59729 RepID=UPI003BB86985